jgi:uncharacterized membrane protein/thiol-disulfide isomerase/thioredoxin
MFLRFFKLALLINIFIASPSLPEFGHAHSTQDESPIVRAVLFFSPNCGHCHKVITEDLTPLLERYGDQLQIIGINVITEEGQQIYQAYVDLWEIPDTRRGVPTLIIGETALVGSGEIPQFFPEIVETGLSSGGIDWPTLPGLEEILSRIENESDGQEQNVEVSPTAEVDNQIDNQATPTEESTEVPPTSTKEVLAEKLADTPSGVNEPKSQLESEINNPAAGEANTNIIIPYDDDITVADRFQQDLAGNILAVLVLAGMIISVLWVLASVIRSNTTRGKDFSWVIPILSFIGIFVAGYLSFVEVTETEAVCGPVGNCNTVQQSPYAVIFGFIHVGVLGLMGYIAILIAWILNKQFLDNRNDILKILIWAMALFGVIFSIYLTFLEPFVIGATCLWCLTSAVIITLQLLAATEPVRQIWVESEEDDD